LRNVSNIQFEERYLRAVPIRKHEIDIEILSGFELRATGMTIFPNNRRRESVFGK
jgi:hypothetical protein